MKPLRLLLVEDSENDAMLLLDYLRLGGYEPQFTRVDSAKALNAALDDHDWDLVIADYTMPGFSGSAALTIVRDRGLEVPFIFVSGTIGEEIAVEAMKNGADDYIIKNNLTRLIPAINRELRDAEVRRERSKAEERIRHLAYYDSLTDLPNRTLFQNRLEMAVANALRTGNPLSVLIMDLDGFKEINDTMGHLMGDAVLREIGRRLLIGLRDSDTVARLGGDEFAVMLPGVSQSGGMHGYSPDFGDNQGIFLLNSGLVQSRADVGVVNLVDIFPTALTLLGLPIPQTNQGRSVLGI
jgi:PleD family two-component response regulator